MADLSNTQIDQNVPESGSFTVLPEGFYLCVIINDEIKDTQKGGKMLEINLLVIDGQYKGETLTDRLNIINASSIAQKIGQGTLKKLCRLTGLEFPPKNTAGWKGKPLMVKVGIQKFNSNTTGKELESNEVKDYKEFVKQEQQITPPQKTTGAW
ncbi:MAG: hypothetical protein A3K77_00765 [Euryarchaeota archaeon RBG_13_31_8]|nr:MAG: hypothetical protein A3K77_00765 [Euryarchaeota archaeon RBG_13_31_8]